MVEFSFYRDAYRGSSIPEADWALFEARAADQLARYKRIYILTLKLFPNLIIAHKKSSVNTLLKFFKRKNKRTP